MSGTEAGTFSMPSMSSSTPTYRETLSSIETYFTQVNFCAEQWFGNTLEEVTEWLLQSMAPLPLPSQYRTGAFHQLCTSAFPILKFRGSPPPSKWKTCRKGAECQTNHNPLVFIPGGETKRQNSLDQFFIRNYNICSAVLQASSLIDMSITK